MYDKEKIKEFIEYVIEDYNSNLLVERIANVNTTEKTDGSFIQIGIKPLLDEDMFISPNFDPRLPSAGRLIAVGEEEFLIDSLLKNEEIKFLEFKEDIIEFPKYVYDFDNPIILLSTKFYVEFFTKLMHRIDYEEKYPRLDKRYRILAVPENVLSNKIIIIDKEAIFWEKELFYNEIIEKKEKIDIKIKQSTLEKVEITIRSVNKIKYLDPELIKILEVKNG